MYLDALKINEKLNYKLILGLTILVIFLFVGATAAIAENAKGSWDQWLDSAYQLTWHDQADIAKWISKNEAVIFDKKLSQFAEEWELRFNAIPEGGTLNVFPDETFRQLAIAQMLLYLQSSDFEYLKKAMALMNAENLKAKLEVPEISFWYYYISAHYHMEKGEPDLFVKDVFHVWLDVILELESEKYEIGDTFSGSSLQGFSGSIPYLYRNLANLILQRAIVEHKLAGIDGLGVIVWNLSHRMPSKGYGKWIEEVVKRINGPDSDNYRLSFTVQVMEATKKRVIFEDLFDAGKPPSIIEKNLADNLAHYEMLYDLAKTLHGRATAMTKQLQFTSMVLAKLYENGPHQAALAGLTILKRRKGKAWHEEKAAIEQAIEIYDNLSKVSINNTILTKNGFLSQKSYVSTMHELWRAIMNASLDTAIYYDRQINTKIAKSMQVNIPLLENALIRYLDFFERHVNKGYKNIVPDNAFYGAFEAAALLSEMHYISAPWEKGMQKYDLALARRLQAMEIYPFDVKKYYVTAQRLSELGRLGLYKRYFFLLARRIENSNLFKTTNIQQSRYLNNDLVQLQKTIPEIIKRAPFNILLQYGLQQAPPELSKRLALIYKEATTNSKNSQLDAESRKQIAEMAQQLKQRLKTKKVYPKEEILSFLKDIDPLVAFIDEKLKSAPPRDTDDVLLPFGQDLFPRDFKQLSLELKQLKEECVLLCRLPDISKLPDTLVFEVDHPFHTFLRRFYHENSRQDLNYLHLLSKIPSRRR